VGAHPPFSTLSRPGLNPIKLAYSQSPPDNGLGQYVSCSPGNRAYCYAELAVSSLAKAVIIASTHFAYPRRHGQAELAWVFTTRTVVIWQKAETLHVCIRQVASWDLQLRVLARGLTAKSF